MTRQKTIEIELSNFDGTHCDIQHRWERTDKLELVADTVARKEVRFTGEERIDHPDSSTDSGYPDRLRTFLNLDFEAPERIRLWIRPSAARLQTVQWELLTKVLPATTIFRFTPTIEDARPRIRRRRPNQAVIALPQHKQQNAADWKFAGITPVVLGQGQCSKSGIIQAIKDLPSSPTEAGDGEPAEDPFLVITTELLLRTPDLEIALEPTPNSSAQVALAQDHVPVYEFAGALRSLGAKSPRLVMIVRFMSAKSNPYQRDQMAPRSFAHALSAIGIPAVVILPELPVQQGIDDLQCFLKAFGEQLENKKADGKKAKDKKAEDENTEDDLTACVWVAWRECKEQRPGSFTKPPFLLINARSGAVWYTPRFIPPPAPDGEPIVIPADTYKKARRKTVVVGPLYKGGRWQWLRAPLDSLASSLGFPMHAEHRTPELLGSYILALRKNRHLLEALYFLSWIDAAASLWKGQASTLNALMEEPGHQEGAKLVNSITVQPPTPGGHLNLGFLVRTVLNVNVTLDKFLEESQSSTWQDRRNMAEQKLKRVFDLFLANQKTKDLLLGTPYGDLAKLNADLYISTDPTPMLEYALIANKRRVSFMIYPWVPDGDTWFPSGANEKTEAPVLSPPGTPSPAASKPREARVLYLCGGIHVPPVVLLTEEEIVEMLILSQGRWSRVLEVIGSDVGHGSATLFVGFEPQDPTFRQILRTLFLDRIGVLGDQFIVSVRPDEDLFSDPAQARLYLKTHFEDRLLAARHRALELFTGARIGTSRPQQSMHLYWGSPLEFVKSILPVP